MDVVVDVVPGHRLLEKRLLQQEVVVVLDTGFLQISARVVAFDLEEGVEETPVFVVHLGELDSECLVPSVRIWDWEDGLGCCRA